MTDKFLGTGGGGGNITNGSLNILGATISAINLNPSKAMKTDALGRIYSTNLSISDITGLTSSNWNRTIGTPNLLVPVNSGDYLGVDNIRTEDGTNEIIIHNKLQYANTETISDDKDVATKEYVDSQLEGENHWDDDPGNNKIIPYTTGRGLGVNFITTEDGTGTMSVVNNLQYTTTITPSDDKDIATKKYVDDNTPSTYWSRVLNTISPTTSGDTVQADKIEGQTLSTTTDIGSMRIDTSVAGETSITNTASAIINTIALPVTGFGGGISIRRTTTTPLASVSYNSIGGLEWYTGMWTGSDDFVIYDATDTKNCLIISAIDQKISIPHGLKVNTIEDFSGGLITLTDSVLINNTGNDSVLTLNKANDSDDASILFNSNSINKYSITVDSANSFKITDADGTNIYFEIDGANDDVFINGPLQINSTTSDGASLDIRGNSNGEALVNILRDDNTGKRAQIRIGNSISEWSLGNQVNTNNFSIVSGLSGNVPLVINSTTDLITTTQQNIKHTGGGVGLVVQGDTLNGNAYAQVNRTNTGSSNAFFEYRTANTRNWYLGLENGGNNYEITNDNTNHIVLSANYTTDVCSFYAHPVGPSSAPTNDYQLANKKYVDDSVGGVGLWQDVASTYIEPNPNRLVRLTRDLSVAQNASSNSFIYLDKSNVKEAKIIFNVASAQRWVLGDDTDNLFKLTGPLGNIFDCNNAGTNTFNINSTIVKMPNVYGDLVSGGIAMYMKTDGQIGTSISLREVKDNIIPIGDKYDDLIYNTEIVNFNFKGETDIEIGSIADDVEQLKNGKDLCFYKDGKLRGIRYERYVPLLIDIVKKHKKKINSMEKRLKMYENENMALNEQIRLICSRLEILEG